MLNDEYRRVAANAEAAQENSSQAARWATVHAFWMKGSPDKTMCGQVDVLDITDMPKNRVVSCEACRKALKRERQRRSREGTARYQERMREHRDQVEDATAGYESAASIGPDMVWVPTEEIDRILVNTMRMRAESLRREGNDDLAADLEIAANRLVEHAQIPDDTSVPQAPADALSEDKYDGHERRMRPRMIEPVTPFCDCGDDDLCPHI